ncbi:MAG: LysM peptidoglycan-binding domain-containing protein [Betaproteobacteria bacterium]|nr:LysM peptidoglycan-binding domain-containing protein [Betaproteobacteria bacterium]
MEHTPWGYIETGLMPCALSRYFQERNDSNRRCNFPVLFLLAVSQQPVPAVDRSSSPVRAAAQPAGRYTVKRGDTLNRIALEPNGQDHRDIVTWNNIANPSAIKEGQILRVAPPVAAIEADCRWRGHADCRGFRC